MAGSNENLSPEQMKRIAENRQAAMERLVQKGHGPKPSASVAKSPGPAQRTITSYFSPPKATAAPAAAPAKARALASTHAGASVSTAVSFAASTASASFKPKPQAEAFSNSMPVTPTKSSAAAPAIIMMDDDDDMLDPRLEEEMMRIEQEMAVESARPSVEAGFQTEVLLSPRRRSATKRLRNTESSDEEDGDAAPVTPVKKPKGRLIKPRRNADDGDDGDFEPNAAESSESDGLEDFVVEETEEQSAQLDDDDDDGGYDDRLKTPKRKKQARSTGSAKLSSPSPAAAKFQSYEFSPASSRPQSPRLTTPAEKSKMRQEEFKKKNEERFSWLVDIRDKMGRRSDDPEYDARTLFIPASAQAKFTPFEKQFWEIKSEHWDTVVFFKKGKFYELYEKDADIGHQDFDLKLTDRVNMRMVGVPESSFEHWASQFIAKGYKVAKVDQMESAIGKSIREKKEQTRASKEDKIIRRELTSILTCGTLVDGKFLTADMSTYCMSIKESVESEASPPTFGIAFVDTATAEFNICEFADDIERTKFETLLMQIKPKELVLEKGHLSQRSLRLVKNILSSPQLNYLVPDTEFWDSAVTRDELSSDGYFKDGNSMETNTNESWPEALREYQDHNMALSALGGLLFYLRSLKLDKQLVSVKNFHVYDPIRQSGTLILDGQTLLNLEIFENSLDGSGDGTLFQLLNRCVTPFGKRLFKRWVCHPLRSVDNINDRLNAVDDFTNLGGLREILQAKLSKFPDLERIISRIHAGTCRVKEFVRALNAFEEIASIVDDFAVHLDELTSRRLIHIAQHGLPEELRESLAYFRSAFDHALALKEDKLLPFPGGDEEYDTAQKRVKDLETRFADYKRSMESNLRTKIVYKDLGKEIYQMEISNKVKVPNDWVVMSRTQAVHRYYNPTIRDMVKRFDEAVEMREEAFRNIKGRMYSRFDEHYAAWLQTIKNISELDGLIGLSLCRATMGEPLCRPEFVPGDTPSVLELEQMRHPCITRGSGTDFIPNDTTLGGGAGKHDIILLTGPNMGGKSTLLRQTCIAVIMAQIGCYVPAASCKLTPFDRIFTRIGANDNIMAGQSTFMVELSETSKILREATPRSLVILDELGRGTSTFDGYAIAFSVLHYLTTHVRCLGLFSTHYGMLTEEFKSNPLVGLMFMNFYSDDNKREVTFLYKLTKGVCPKSFGMNVASMAGVPEEIIATAEEVAAEFEREQKTRQINGVGLHGQLSLTRQSDFCYLLAGSRNNQSSISRAIWRSLQHAIQ
ncbi:DNA mismatch repair protein msh6 [Polychytrium aggregatum]|uniref:DNA mismatch repair protein msh6 n=1 Tax=Polychytrium aggregatum TaxID=110093 RepID=UPI0022FE2612|nr:DNA mismatch repair protein msh6 [Polychytrium aggregatum]KAI9201827.1 DNA mismatch repair protein msh6 [Polychytrium aggregatum]